MIALIALGGLAVVATLTTMRLMLGPTLQDRALAAVSLVIKGAVACAAIAVLIGRSEAADAALALVLSALVLLAAVLKFFKARTYQPPLAREEAS